MAEGMSNLEEVLKNKYNEYIDALVNYLNALKDTEENNGSKYIY